MGATKANQAFLFACLLFGFISLWPISGGVHAQEQEAEQAEAQGGTPVPGDRISDNSDTQTGAAQKPSVKSLYFLGDKPQLQRQQGPALGKPVSILPHPFVPKGSVALPPAPVGTELNAEEGEGANPETLDVISGISDESGELVSEVSTDAAADVPVDADNAAATEEQFVEVSVLDQLDPSGIGVLPLGEGYARDFWATLSRQEIIELYEAFSTYSGSPALRSIAGKVAMSGVILPSPDSDADVIRMLDARLSLLAATANADAYRTLLDKLPEGRDWSALSRHVSNLYLLDGRLSDACTLATVQRETDSDPHWIRITAFCYAAQANRSGVDFELEVLSELTEVPPTFYQLIDQILVEAEQPPGSVMTEPTTLSGALDIQLLEVAMARLARSKVLELSLDVINPLAVKAMIALPGLDTVAKTGLVGLGLQKGWIDGADIASFARTLDVSDEEKSVTFIPELAPTEAGEQFVRDSVLLHLVGIADAPADMDVSDTPEDLSVARASSDRIQATYDLWASALFKNYIAAVAPGISTLADDVPIAAGAGSAADIYARAAFIAGNATLSEAWFTTFRAHPMGANASADARLISLMPLAVVAGLESAPVMAQQKFTLWWQAEGEREDRFVRGNLLFSILEALGTTVPEPAWQLLEAGPAVVGNTAMSPALWRRFLQAAREDNKPQALAQAFKLMANNGPAGVSATLAGSLVGTLKGLGFDAEARRIALEILIGQGL